MPASLGATNHDLQTGDQLRGFGQRLQRGQDSLFFAGFFGIWEWWPLDYFLCRDCTSVRQWDHTAARQKALLYMFVGSKKFISVKSNKVCYAHRSASFVVWLFLANPFYINGRVVFFIFHRARRWPYSAERANKRRNIVKFCLKNFLTRVRCYTDILMIA